MSGRRGQRGGAGGGGGIWGKGGRAECGGEREGEGGGGLLAKRQTGAAPLESLKWQTLKRGVFFGSGEEGGREGGAAAAAGAEEDENIPQDEQATEFLSLHSTSWIVTCASFSFCCFF